MDTPLGKGEIFVQIATPPGRVQPAYGKPPICSDDLGAVSISLVLQHREELPAALGGNDLDERVIFHHLHNR